MPSNQVTSSNAGSRELHAFTKARYQKQMREELLSKGALVSLCYTTILFCADCTLCIKPGYIISCVNVFVCDLIRFGSLALEI